MGSTITYIGKIHSSLQKLEDCPRQEFEHAPEATIILDEVFAEAAKDIQPGDTLIILTWLHQSSRNEFVTRPRNNPDAPLTGVFSTRSPNRPNPIGLHNVTVVKKISPVEWLISAIEVLNGTPVIDIKPIL